MGLTIHYNGTFKKNASLSEMIEEVKDIAQVYKWGYHIFEKEFPKGSFGKMEFNENIYGIVFSPPKCEGISLCFLSNGRMGNPSMLEYWLQSKNTKDKRLVFVNFTKTQYAGPAVHKIIIDLFRYLSKKYFKTFMLFDEANYWQTNDEMVLRNTFKEWGALIGGFSDALKNPEKKKGETIEDLIVKAAKRVNARRKK